MSDKEPTEAYVYQPEPSDSPLYPKIYGVAGPGTWMYRDERMTKEKATRIVQQINLAAMSDEECKACGVHISELHMRDCPIWLLNLTRQQVQELVTDLAARDQRIAQLEAKENYWAWQGDGEDHLASLTCPVLIEAADLRELLAARNKRIEELEEISELVHKMVADLLDHLKILNPSTRPSGRKET